MSGLRKAAFARALDGTGVRSKRSADEVVEDVAANGTENDGGSKPPPYDITGYANAESGETGEANAANGTENGTENGTGDVNAANGTENDGGTGDVNAANGTENDGGTGDVNAEDGTASVAKSGRLTYEQWLASRGCDPDGDFSSGAAELNYLYETWQVGYGARAERLYQLGLSDSGYADIYGVNAYASYISAMNDLNLERISQNRKYKALYAEYCYEYDKKQSEAEQSAYAYAEGMRTAGYSADTVRTSLINNGYGDYVDGVEEKLARFGDGYFENLAAANVYATLVKQFPNYSGTDAEDLAVEQYLKALGIDDTAVSAALELAHDALGVGSVTVTGTDGSSVVLTAVENETVITLGNRYLASLGDGEYIAETDEASVRGFLRASNVTDERLVQAVLAYISEQESYDAETAKKREARDIGSRVDGIESADASSLSFAELDDALAQYAEYYGSESMGYAAISSAVKKKAGEVVSAVLDRWSSPDSLTYLFGSSLDGATFTDAGGSSFTWSDGTDAQRRGAVEALVTQYYTSGLISGDDYIRFVSAVLPRELALAESISDASDALMKYRAMLGDGSISPSQYGKIESVIADTVSYRIERINERTHSTHATVETSKGDRIDLLLSGGFDVSDADIEKNGLNGTCFVILSSHLYVYDGGTRKLYAVDSLNASYWTDEQENTMLDIFKLSARTAHLGTSEAIDNTLEPSQSGGGVDAVSGKQVRSYTLPNGTSVDVPEEYDLKELPSGEIVAVPRDGERGKVYTVYDGK